MNGIGFILEKNEWDRNHFSNVCGCRFSPKQNNPYVISEVHVKWTKQKQNWPMRPSRTAHTRPPHLYSCTGSGIRMCEFLLHDISHFLHSGILVRRTSPKLIEVHWTSELLSSHNWWRIHRRCRQLALSRQYTFHKGYFVGCEEGHQSCDSSLTIITKNSPCTLLFVTTKFNRSYFIGDIGLKPFSSPTQSLSLSSLIQHRCNFVSFTNSKTKANWRNIGH